MRKFRSTCALTVAKWNGILVNSRLLLFCCRLFNFELLDTSSKWRILLNTYLWWRILALRLSARQAVSLCFYLETVDFFSTPKCKWDDCLLCCFSLSRGLNLTFPLFTALTFSQAWSIHTILYRYRLTGLSNWILFFFSSTSPLRSTWGRKISHSGFSSRVDKLSHFGLLFFLTQRSSCVNTLFFNSMRQRALFKQLRRSAFVRENRYN